MRTLIPSQPFFFLVSFNMNPSSPSSSTHEEHTFDPQSAEIEESRRCLTTNLDLNKDEARFTACQNTREWKVETNLNSNQEGKLSLDLNYPNVDPITGYRIVNGAIYIDSDDDDGVHTETREQYGHNRTKYTRAEKGKAKIVEAEGDAWLTLGLGLPSMHQLYGQVQASTSPFPSTSGTNNNKVLRDFVCSD